MEIILFIYVNTRKANKAKAYTNSYLLPTKMLNLFINKYNSDATQKIVKESVWKREMCPDTMTGMVWGNYMRALAENLEFT